MNLSILWHSSCPWMLYTIWWAKFCVNLLQANLLPDWLSIIIEQKGYQGFRILAVLMQVMLKGLWYQVCAWDIYDYYNGCLPPLEGPKKCNDKICSFFKGLPSSTKYFSFVFTFDRFFRPFSFGQFWWYFGYKL